MHKYTNVRLTLLIVIASCVPAHAQITTVGSWNIAEVHSACIPIEESDLDAESRECTVAEFDKVVTIDKQTFYYALYRDFLPQDRQPEKETHSNVAVIFRGSIGSGEVTVFHVRNHLRRWFYSYDLPRLLDSDRGPVLHLPGSGLGDSRLQFSYDEYWLWRDDTWVQLDVWGWTNSWLDEYLPAGLNLDGIRKSDFNLPSMQYSGMVRRSDDCHTCATGGSATISFEWDDLVLKIRNVEYFPSTK